jgi:hypothetical protein
MTIYSQTENGASAEPSRGVQASHNSCGSNSSIYKIPTIHRFDILKMKIYKNGAG